MALASSTVVISRNLSFSARTLVTACAARPAPLPAGGAPARWLADRACGQQGPCCFPPMPDVNVCPPLPGPCRPCCNAGPCQLCAPPCPCPPIDRPCASTASAAGGEPVRRSASCTHVAGPLRRHLGTLPALRAESATLIQKRRSSDKAHDAGCPCPSPCGPCGCPKGCGCLPPPCNLPPKCIQYMTGYYYYPYGTWFAGPYHVQGICQPVGKDTLSCDQKSQGGPTSCPPKPKDCSEQSSNSLLDYCKKIKQQCVPTKADCPKPCGPPKPSACPPKPACSPKPPGPPPKSPCPPKTCQAKPTVTCSTPKAKSLSEICKSTKKPSPSRPSSPPRSAKSSQSVCTKNSAPACPPVAKPKSSTGIFSSKKKPADSGASKVKYQPTPSKSDRMPTSILDFYLKAPQKPSTKPV